MIPSTLIIYTAIAVIVACASVLAFMVGVKRGRDIGWVEYHFQQMKRERRKRNKYGRFRVKSEWNNVE